MPTERINGIRLDYDVRGDGPPVVLVMGTGTGGQAWHLHQVPALVEAGYRAITYNNRGIPPTDECADGFTLDDLVDDLAALVDHLGLPSYRLLGTSMGAFVAQELALRRPEAVTQLLVLATRARCDELRTAMATAELELHDALAAAGVQLPARYDAVVRAMQNLSPRTLDDATAVRDWLDLFEVTASRTAGLRAQLALDPVPDRRVAYRAVRVPTRVVAFADDLITPPRLGREVADAIPGAEFELIAGCGHYGYLEDPDAVTKTMLEFFGGAA